MRKKRETVGFNGWCAKVDTSNLEDINKKVKRLEKEVERDLIIIDEFRSFVDAFVESTLKTKIESCINSLPSFTKNLDKAAEFISEFICDFDDIDSAVRFLSKPLGETYDSESFDNEVSSGDGDLNEYENNSCLNINNKENETFEPITNVKVDLHLQPVISLTRINVPELFKTGSINNVSPKRNTRQSCSKTKPGSLPGRNEESCVAIKDHGSALFCGENDNNSCIPEFDSDYLNDTIETESESYDNEEPGQCGRGLPVQNDGTPDEYLSEIYKTIDTFMGVMRKTADDSSIQLALKRNFKCNLCQKRFLKKETLRKHMVICELRDNKKIPKKKLRKDGNYPCNMCGISYLTKYSREKHEANVHNLRKLFKCLVCRRSFYNEEALMLHCRSRHALGGSGIYKCPYCEEKFNVRTYLNYHCRKYHKTTKYYICPKCLECFKTEDMCKLHEQSHGYSCDICMFTTKKESELIAHRSTHLHLMIYKCDRCAKTFKGKQYFTKHIKIHERG